MIKQKKNKFTHIFGIIFGFTIGTLIFVQASDLTISVAVNGLGIRHGTPENFSFGTITGSLSDQYISGHFIDPFRIEDLEGRITGHYTTIQCDGVYNQDGYRLTGVEFKAGNITPELLAGSTGNHVKIPSLLSNYTNIIEPVTYIYKETHADNLGLVNRYGDRPRLKILIPSVTPPGIYSGTIVFSFYME